MNILLLNGSPREKGNTKAALTMLEAILPADAKVEMVNVPGLHLGGCKSCFACRKNGGTCVQPDGGAELLAKIAAADVVVFASPVYFMGISAQLKAVIDRFFSQVDAYKAATKKVALIVIGGTAPPAGQYDLISGHMQSLCDYLGWQFVGQCASGSFLDDSAKTAAVQQQLQTLAAKF